MANNQELTFEWSMLDENYQNWTLNDLQLAAELGRTLLDRNEELENELKTQQAIIEDQKQEIEFQLKQINSMKEESANRNKCYDQLENSFYELERSNSQLTKKYEFDKRRMQSMSENIEYLERKCEELNGTLESIRDTNKKPYNGNKFNRSSYFLQFPGLGPTGVNGAGSSDSSEDDSGYFRRRTQSLQDLRDYSSSPDELLLDSSPSSDSPDLKLSENEFIQTLESRIEELIAAKKKESQKISALENEVKFLVEENSNLRQELSLVSHQKGEQIDQLHQQLIDQHGSPSNSLRYSLVSTSPTPTQENGSIVNFAIGSHTNSPSSLPPSATKSQRNSFNYKRQLQEQQQQKSATAVCKRCSEEINILSLVNSIEDDQINEGANFDDEEFSSLEFELAKATNGCDDNLFIHQENSNNLQQQNSILVLRRNSFHSRRSFDLQDSLFNSLNYFTHNNGNNNQHRLQSDFQNDNNGFIEDDEFGNTNEIYNQSSISTSKPEFKSIEPPLDRNETHPNFQTPVKGRLKLPEKIPVEFNHTSMKQDNSENNSHETEGASQMVNNINDTSGHDLDSFCNGVDTDSYNLGVRKRSRIQQNQEQSEIMEYVQIQTDYHQSNSTLSTPTPTLARDEDEESASSSSTIPDYKQILQNLFSLLKFGFTATTLAVGNENDEEELIAC